MSVGRYSSVEVDACGDDSQAGIGQNLAHVDAAGLDSARESIAAFVHRNRSLPCTRFDKTFGGHVRSLSACFSKAVDVSQADEMGRKMEVGTKVVGQKADAFMAKS